MARLGALSALWEGTRLLQAARLGIWPDAAAMLLPQHMPPRCLGTAALLCPQMAQLVTEKDSGLRQAMRTMGLMESSYWGSWVVFDLAFGTILTLVIVVSGALAWQWRGRPRAVRHNEGGSDRNRGSVDSGIWSCWVVPGVLLVAQPAQQRC